METHYRRWLALFDFSARSLAQPYGTTFLGQVLLRHPLCATRGLRDYLRQSAQTSPHRLLGAQSADQWVQQAARDAGKLLVATGFCQRPLATARGDRGCPAGRFNHRCLYLSHLERDAKHTRMSPACADCSIRLLGRAALLAGASFAVLTSALDIAHDILLPALKEQRFERVLFAICPYSIEPMSLALAMCGLQGMLIPFDAGACADYGEWLRADGGLKPERTTLSSGDLATMLHLLQRIATARGQLHLVQPTSYVYCGHVYRPTQRPATPF